MRRNLFLFLVMAMFFESLLLPFTVIFTVPFALLGSFWALFLTRTPMDPIGVIGMIILAGVVINHCIVLIDRIRSLRHEMPDRLSAVLEGSRQRVRPVLMTALTTVVGLLPMIFADPPRDGVRTRRSDRVEHRPEPERGGDERVLANDQGGQGEERLPRHARRSGAQLAAAARRTGQIAIPVVGRQRDPTTEPCGHRRVGERETECRDRDRDRRQVRSDARAQHARRYRGKLCTRPA